MYDKNSFKEVTKDILDDFEALTDGNFALIDQRYILELTQLDFFYDVLSIIDTGHYEITDARSFMHEQNQNRDSERFFVGVGSRDEQNDAASELYYSLIKNRNVAEFLEMFTS